MRDLYSHKFSSSFRIKSKREFESVFRSGKRVKVGLLTLLWLESELGSPGEIRVAFVVPKRRVRKAVYRNRIRRLLREMWRRWNKCMIIQANIDMSLKTIIIYTGHDNMDKSELHKAFLDLMHKFVILWRGQ